MKKSMVILFLALALVLGWSSFCFAQASGEAELEQQMLELVNKERVEAGLSPLKMDKELVQLARLKSQDMIDKNYFSHTSPTYGDPFEMMKNYGVQYWMAGENLAGNPSITGAHESLMNSPGHRANILKPEFTHVGIGVIKGGPYGMMVTQMFIKSREVETNNQPEEAKKPSSSVNNKEPKEFKEPQTGATQLSIYYNDKKISFPDIVPFINSNQRIMVPLRFISQEMGYEVKWEGNEQKISIKSPEAQMDLWIGKNMVRKNNQLFIGDSTPIIHNDRTMVPLRMVSELLGCKVTWYPTLNKAVIN